MKKKTQLLFSIFFLLLSGIVFSQQKVKVYKIDDLVKRISNPDTIYIVNFWATWCKPCCMELPDFEKLSRDSAKTNVKVLMVSMDFKEDMKERLQPFLKKNKISAEVVLLDENDATTFIPMLDDRWSGAIPATIVKKGDKKLFAEKKLKGEELRRMISEVIKS
jgi:thiol-disulfide isomerase/thioredoxin